MRSHDDQIGVHLDRHIVDVVKQVPNPHCHFGGTLKSLQMFFCKCMQSGSSFTKLTLFAHNVDQMQFTLEGFAHGHGVVQGIRGHWREVNGDEDAVL